MPQPNHPIARQALADSAREHQRLMAELAACDAAVRQAMGWRKKSEWTSIEAYILPRRGAAG